MKRYGTTNGFNVEKAKETWINNLGVDNPMKSDKVKKKKEQTFIDKYGINVAAKSDLVKEKNIGYQIKGRDTV